MSQEQKATQQQEQQKAASKYVDRILQSQEQKDAQQSQFRADEAKYALEGNILETRKKIAELESSIERAKSTYPLNPKTILESITALAEYKLGLEGLEKLKSELF